MNDDDRFYKEDGNLLKFKQVELDLDELDKLEEDEFQFIYGTDRITSDINPNFMLSNIETWFPCEIWGYEMFYKKRYISFAKFAVDVK